jgi:AraC-like DNA-binding protein
MAFQFRTIGVPIALKSYVRNYWVFESGVENVYTNYSTASIFPKITFNYSGRFYARLATNVKEELYTSGLSAPSSTSLELETAKENTGVFGIFLYPQAVQALFGIPANVLVNENIDLETLLGQEGRRWEEEMMLATDNEQRATLASRFIWQQLQKNDDVNDLRVVPAIQRLAMFEGVPDMKDLANNYFLSQRQFERVFKRLTGFAPKYFHRVARFERTLKACLLQEQTFTDIAYTCGYADQAHFNHDFKKFSGFSPSQYADLAADHSAFTSS